MGTGVSRRRIATRNVLLSLFSFFPAYPLFCLYLTAYPYFLFFFLLFFSARAALPSLSAVLPHRLALGCPSYAAARRKIPVRVNTPSIFRLPAPHDSLTSRQ